jgi:diguanylate cyclase (GGDEF)-like protein
MYKILIVDDLVQRRNGLVRQLVAEGFETIEADCGNDALKELKSNLPEAILVDMSLPDMTGVELYKQITANVKQYPVYIIIMLNEIDNLDIKTKYPDIEPCHYVVRPLNVETLLPTIRIGISAVVEKRSAIIDETIGIYNQTFFNAIIVQESEKAIRYDRRLCLVLFELDRFSQISAEHGRLAADLTLRRFGKLLRTESRSGDLTALLGERFAVLLPETDLQGAVIFAERIKQILGKTDFPCPCQVTACAGAATFTDSCDEMVQAAVRSLIMAQQSGLNQLASEADLVDYAARLQVAPF